MCSESHTEEAELSWLFKEYEQAKRLDALVRPKASDRSECDPCMPPLIVLGMSVRVPRIPTILAFSL